VDFAAGSYGAIKAALIHYSKGLSNQLVATGISVNVVSRRVTPISKAVSGRTLNAAIATCSSIGSDDGGEGFSSAQKMFYG
jgi:NAD(P)-dependent dehydrogenase (short-subunit alcohol dehydrogenase family)